MRDLSRAFRAYIWVDEPLKSATHGRCDARPTVTFPAAERLQTSTKSCLVTRAQGCKQLAQNHHGATSRPGLEPATSGSQVPRPTYPSRRNAINPAVISAAINGKRLSLSKTLAR